MQLFSDLFAWSNNERDMDQAIAELQRALPIAALHDIDRQIEELQKTLPIPALQFVISERRRRHKPYKKLERYLQSAVAAEIRRENITTIEGDMP